MAFTYSVTFEFDEQAPQTVRGEVAAIKAQTAAYRAVVAARKARPKTKARSIVVVLEPVE